MIWTSIACLAIIASFVYLFLAPISKFKYKKKEAKRDWEGEYQKIKSTAIMKEIRICRMEDGQYKIIKKGRPIISLFVYKNHPKKLITSKEDCCEKCVNYYLEEVANKKSNTVVETI